MGKIQDAQSIMGLRIICMKIRIKDTGFCTQAENFNYICIESSFAETDLATLLNHPAVEINFPSFSDGRGFTLARLLRLRGFKGRLRAIGHIIPDQYAMVRRSGFDEILITPMQAKTHPEARWVARSNWRARNYQHRLRIQV